MKIDFLVLGALFSFTAAMLHLAIIMGGPSWYRFFGAGEAMASMAQAGMLKPTLITVCIAIVLTTWACYALSGAGVLPKLPMLKLGLTVITLIYLLRGLAGFLAVFYSDHPMAAQNSSSFWVLSSLICLGFGLVHLKGLVDNWSAIS